MFLGGYFMKKVLCNVLYGVSIPACRVYNESVTIDLGLFKERQDAECAGMITKKILNSENPFYIISVGDYEVQKEFFPDAEMNSVKVTDRLNKDLNDFVMKNPITQNFMDEKGFVELGMLVLDCEEEYLNNQKSSKASAQKGEE